MRPTLDYPPTGSPETAGADPQDAIGAERLSLGGAGMPEADDAAIDQSVDEQEKA